MDIKKTGIGSELRDRLSTDEYNGPRFDKLKHCSYYGSGVPLLNALIHSVKTGSTVRFVNEGKSIYLSIGMVDTRNEPWNHKTTLFYGYQFRGDVLTRHSQIYAIWIGELTTNPSKVILRHMREFSIPAETAHVPAMRTPYELRSGELKCLTAYEDHTLNRFAVAMKTRSILELQTTRTVFGGEKPGTYPYSLYYLPTLLERGYPWVRSEVRDEAFEDGNTEYPKRLKHGGFAIVEIDGKEGPQLAAYQAAGYLNSADGAGGSFRHTKEASHVFPPGTRLTDIAPILAG